MNLLKYLLPVCFLCLIACNNQQQENTDDAIGDVELPNGFSEFYQRFHSDSTFQMDHIIFPLEGVPDNADKETIDAGEFRWQRKDWSLMHPVDYQMSEYQRQFIPLTDEMVVERILHKNGQFGMVRRFAIISDEWHLIYYAGVNRLAQ